MPRYHAVTLGCKVNQYETEYLCQGLESLGYRPAQPGEQADLCVVNTCTVTTEADHKSRKAIRQLARRFPQARLIVMGCYATRAAEELSALPGVAEVITDKQQLPQLLMRLGLSVPPLGVGRFGNRKRAYVKIQDGCNMPCSYCIIPKVRPVLISRRPHEVLDEISRLVASGYREVVLTGIHLGLYGADFGHCPLHAGEPSQSLAAAHSAGATHLTALLRQVLQLPGKFRVRLSSLEASEVSDELLSIVCDNPQRICQHLHLSMQSGSDAVLRRMRRPWPAQRFLERCLQIRDRLPGMALTADVIVGFPGETEEDFAATCQAVEAIGFAKLHIFRFSPRPGTAAAKLPERVPNSIKQQRAERLGAIGDRLRRQYMQTLLGQRLEVLIEESVPAGGIGQPPVCATRSCRPQPDWSPPQLETPRSPSETTEPVADRAEATPGCSITAGAPAVLLGTASQYVPVELPGDRQWVGELVEATACAVDGDRLRAVAGLR